MSHFSTKCWTLSGVCAASIRPGQLGRTALLTAVSLSLSVLSLTATVHAMEGTPAAGLQRCAAPSSACHVSENRADLTLATAVRLTLEHNRELAAAAREISGRDGAVLQAGLLKNPTISAEAEDIRRQERSTTLRVGQLFELGGKRNARRTAAALARDSATQDYELRRRTVILNVAQGFTELLAAQQQRALAQEGMALAERVLAAAARRVQAGKVSPVDETKARLGLALARVDVEQAMRDEQTARRRLTLFWGDAGPQFGHAVGDLEEAVTLPSLDTLRQRLRSSAVFLRADTDVAQRRAALALEQANRSPDIAVTAGIRKFAQGGENGLLVGVSIPLPLFDNNQGAILQAQQQVLQAQDVQHATQTRLLGDLAQTHDALVAVDAEIRLLRSDVLPASRSVLDAASKGFDYGKFSFLEVVDAQRSLVQQQRLYLRSLANRHRLIAEIDHLLDVPSRSLPASAGVGLTK